MKLAIMTAAKQEVKKKDLPTQFSEPIRPDLVKRAVLAIQSHTRQPYGASPGAGKRASAKLSRRRRDYRGAYGLGISRVPRKIMSRRGTRMSWVGAFAPGMRGGRRAHPPKAEKIWWEKINIQERRKALRSALSATILNDIVKQRNHAIPELYPFILDNSFEAISKTKELEAALAALGFTQELQRVDYAKVRAGRGKARGRKYRKKTGPLLVVGADCSLLKSARNIPGIDVVEVNHLNAELLAPGGNIGRLTLFTEHALDIMEKEQLFTMKHEVK